MTRKTLDHVIGILILVVVAGALAAILLFAAMARAEDKATAKAPTLSDTQRIALLQSEVKVLTSQVENLQAQLTAKDKEFAFKTALSDLYKQGEMTTKDTGADKTDFDLDLNTLTFKERPKPPALSAPVVTPAAPVKK